MESFPFIAAFGPSALVAVAVILVLTGRLIPKGQLDDWKEAHRISERSREVQKEQIDKLLVSAKTVEEIVKDLPSSVSDN